MITISIAGKNVGIDNRYPNLARHGARYHSTGAADFTVAAGEAELARERALNAAADGHACDYSDGYIESLAVYRKIAEKMLDFDTLLFHGSGIAVDGVGYLFAAVSGTGKSTHTRLWREKFGERAVMVNDDKPLLRLTGSGALLCGTPWNGKHGLGAPMEVPLKAIVGLNRAPENAIRRVSVYELLPLLLQQTYRPNNPALLSKTLALVDRLCESIELYTLQCNMNPDAADVSYAGMNRKDCL